MKKQLKKWAFRLTVTVIFIAGLLLVIVLNPILTYAGKTVEGNYTVFHNKFIDNDFKFRLTEATELVKRSEYYNPLYKIDICLNDGSVYPAIIKKLQGQAFAWGFYNKVVLMGNANYKQNYVELNGYKWNFSQLLAHEMIHCFQFDKRGLLNSNPIADIAEWKWEGYPEYIARQLADQKKLKNNIDLLLNTEKKSNNGWIQFADGTGTVIPYYKSWLLVQFCMDIKNMSYSGILIDTTPEQTINQQMMTWYRQQTGIIP
jgi:hypothetical protein